MLDSIINAFFLSWNLLKLIFIVLMILDVFKHGLWTCLFKYAPIKGCFKSNHKTHNLWAKFGMSDLSKAFLVIDYFYIVLISANIEWISGQKFLAVNLKKCSQNKNREDTQKYITHFIALLTFFLVNLRLFTTALPDRKVVELWITGKKKPICTTQQ